MLRFCGPFLFLGSIPALFYGIGGCSPFATVGLLLLCLIAAEVAVPRGAAAPGKGTARWLPLVYIPLQLAVVAWGVWVAANPHLRPLAFASLVVSVGVANGVFGMLAAHEMVHSQSRVEYAFGTVLLTGMSYRQFRIAHIFGHHRWAGTSRDSATARVGEGFYAFLWRTVGGQLVEAWQFEERRRRVKGRAVLDNRVVQDAFITAGLYLAVLAVFSWRGVLFFAGESIAGIVVLELFNYIAHYGLVRAPGEPLRDRHSWNSSNVLANALIFNMGRHSAHHRAPCDSFTELRFVSGAPELPAGYAGSILLALVPPLWHRVMRLELDRFALPEAARATG